MPINMRTRSAAAGGLFLHAETRVLAQHITCAECSKQGCLLGLMSRACMPVLLDAG